MKNLSILMLFAFFTFSAIAQEVKNETNIPSDIIEQTDFNVEANPRTIGKPLLTSGAAGTKATLDTLTEFYDRADSLMLYYYTANNNTYFATGTNDRFVFVGNRFDFNGYAEVKGVLVAYGYQRIRGAADNYNILVYQTNVNGIAAGTGPLGSATLSGSHIETNNLFTHIPFNNHVSVQSNFAVMVQTQNSNMQGDTVDMVAIYTNNAPRGNNEQRALAFKPNSSGGFNSGKIVSDLNGFNADLMILPILNIAAAGVEDTRLEGLTFKGISPNPATTNATLQFSLDNTEQVTITLVDINGRLVKNVVNKRMQAGSHTVNVDVTDLKAGMYFYTIVAGNAKMASKLIVD